MKIQSSIDGKLVQFAIPVKKRYEYVEMQIISDRNRPFSRLSDVSEDHPRRAQETKNNAQHPHDMIFPIVDVKPAIGMKLRFEFAETAGEYCFNTGYNKKLQPISKIVEVESGGFVRWENDMYLSNKQAIPTQMAIITKLSPVAGKVIGEFETLSTYFNGTVLFVGFSEDQEEVLYETEVKIDSNEYRDEPRPSLSTEFPPDVSAVKRSIAEALLFLQNAENTSEVELTRGGLYLFYDYDLRTYRANHWNWTWAPAIKLFLDAAESCDFMDGEALQAGAKRMADGILRFQHPVTDNQILSGIGLGRWQNDLTHPNCTMGYYSLADSSFCAKWGLSEIYKHTREQKYLDSMLALYERAVHWMDRFKVIPSEFQDDISSFWDRTLNEAVFGMGLYTELFKITGDQQYKTSGLRYMDTLIDALYLDDGMWARVYMQEAKANLGFNNDTKGHGWAMDGLLCAVELAPEIPKYLELARKTADFIIEHQNPDGHFDNFFAQAEDGGVGEKSTGLWSWLLYRLYAVTKEEAYLVAARKALVYMINAMEDGQKDPNLRGGVVAMSEQSGIIYRPYFPMACTYATSFFGLAALEELKLHEGSV